MNLDSEDENIELTTYDNIIVNKNTNIIKRRIGSSNDITTMSEHIFQPIKKFNSLPGSIKGISQTNLNNPTRSLTNSPVSNVNRFINETKLNSRSRGNSDNNFEDELTSINGHSSSYSRWRYTYPCNAIIRFDKRYENIYGNKYIAFKNYFKRLIFMYILNICGFLYLHFVRLSHNDDSDIDFSHDDLIFFAILPIFCLFPVNHLLSKNNKKHYLTYILGYFNGINFAVLNNIGNLDEFVLDTYDFKKNDAFHIFVLILLIILCVYSVCYIIYVTKKRLLVATLLTAAFTGFGVYCGIMVWQECEVHIHHYFIGMFLAAISYHPRYITLIISSVSFGVYLEGIVQWGYAPLTYCPSE